MAKVTAEEVKKIAAMTKVQLYDEEIDSIVAQFNDVLSYAERVTQIASQVSSQSAKNSNVVRADVVQVTDSKPIINQAPSHEDNYIVVPKFVEN